MSWGQQGGRRKGLACVGSGFPYSFIPHSLLNSTKAQCSCIPVMVSQGRDGSSYAKICPLLMASCLVDPLCFPAHVLPPCYRADLFYLPLGAWLGCIGSASALLPPNVAWRMDRPQPWYQHAALPGPGTAELFGGSSGSLCSLCSRLGKEGVHGELLLPLLPLLAVKRKGCWTGLSCQFCYYKLFQCSVAPEHWVVSSPPVPLGAGRAVFVTVSCEVLLPGERLVGAFLAPSPVLTRLEHCWLSGAGCYMGLCVPPGPCPFPSGSACRQRHSYTG